MKPTLERYVDDRLEDLEIDRQALGDMLGMSQSKLTRRLNYPGGWHAKELVNLIQALKIKNRWYEDLVVNFGIGKEQCTVAEYETLLKEEGHELGRVNIAA